MKVSAEPSLDAAMLAHEFDKFATLGLVGMIQPTAAIDNVIFLDDAQAAAIGRRVREYKDFVPFIRWRERENKE